MPVAVLYRSNDALAASAYQWLQQYYESLEPPVFQVSPQIIQYRIDDEHLIEPIGV